MIDWLEELLSMTAVEHMDEDTDGENAVLSIGGMAIDAVPPRQARQEEQIDIGLRGQGSSLMESPDNELGLGKGSMESVVLKPTAPQRDGTGEKMAGRQPMSPSLGTEEEAVLGLPRLVRQMAGPVPFAAAEQDVGEPGRMTASGDESVETGERKWVETQGNTGLQTLYRKVVQETSLLGQAAAGGRSGGMAESALAPQMADRLTVDELDQAVRRDSRRYDGGMTLF